MAIDSNVSNTITTIRRRPMAVVVFCFVFCVCVVSTVSEGQFCFSWIFESNGSCSNCWNWFRCIKVSGSFLFFFLPPP